MKKRTAIENDRRRSVETTNARSLPYHYRSLKSVSENMLGFLRSSAARRPCLAPYPSRRFSIETSNSNPLQTEENWIAPAFQEPHSLRRRDDPPVANEYPKTPFSGLKNDIPKYRLHCKSTNNNTIITFTNPVGQTIGWQSGGRCEFKGANRASYEAGYQSAVRIFRVIEKLAEEKDFRVALFFKGFGQGRDALKTALLAVEGQHIRSLVCSVSDRTPIKIGGTRAKKTRRL